MSPRVFPAGSLTLETGQAYEVFTLHGGLLWGQATAKALDSGSACSSIGAFIACPVTE